uniref:Leucine rich repeat containing 43 n=1 Tax=Cairina moschata TaxID=8855 RepID=A0A8C3BU91_CAIMO
MGIASPPSPSDRDGCQEPENSWMAAPGPRRLSAAFREHLRLLGLRDFPCGLGSWNKSRFGTHTSPSGQEEDEDLPLGEESPQALMELLRDPHSPWALPLGCSPQDQQLRDVAVQAPQLVSGTRVLQVFRSLRIVGKDVSAVDEDLLQLQHLEELILCANQISRVTSANLPRTLKVLELCCNAVADLQELCSQPPPQLQHLGLGYNRLCGPSQDKYLTVDFWPNLVSLDLSFNNLTELLELVSQLSSLQKLRVLVLQGNPLALIPAYRGFVVDGLPQLSVLDDIHIEPDERHQFRGLARQPGELIRSEAQVVVSIGKIKGVPDPSALQELEVDTKAAAITYSYCVTYEFAEGEEVEDGGSTEVGWVGEWDFRGSAAPGPDADTARRALPGDSSLFQVTKIHQSPAVATLGADSSSCPLLGKKRSPHFLIIFFSCAAHLFVTPGKPWADTIDCSYRKEHTAKDLVGLKGYLEAGTIVSVVEEKVSYSLHPIPSDKSLPAGPVPKDKQKQKQQEKKKKQPCELRSDPPIQRTLGSRRVSLEALLATEDLVATVCDFGILITEQPLQPPSLEEKVVRSVSWGRAVGMDCWEGGSAHPALPIRPSVPSPKNGAEIALLERHPPLLAALFEIGIISKCCCFLWALVRK